MNPSNSRQGRQKFFTWVVVGCTALAVGYTSWVILRADAGAELVQSPAQGVPPPIAGSEALKMIQNGPHLVFLNEEEPYIGQVKLAALDPSLSRTCPAPVPDGKVSGSGRCQGSAQTALPCGRIHYAGGSGICLMYDSSAPDALTHVTLFGSDFTPRHQFTVEGILSRARISPDGKYAAFTVFVSGHSYQDANMSTATVLLDTTTGASLGNLEEFETRKDGRVFQAPEFNFWGVTFAQDSNRFYATLQNGKKIYLVQGDVPSRKLTVLHENVECPSLSPDGTRLAFKKLIPPGNWQLTVLDLATMKEFPLAETESIDDQVEWLDNNHILYEKIDYDPPKWVSVFVLPADGSGKPEIFMPNAASPAVVRQ